MLKIEGGSIYDPENGVDGAVGNIWIEDGRIVAAPAGQKPSRTIDARGLVVMPGGVDMHCHIAGPKVNAGRKLRPDDKRAEEDVVRRKPLSRSGTLGSVPSTFVTAYKYAALGYTTAFDAAVPPMAARQAHQELADTPCVDKGFYVLLGNNQYAMRQLKRNDPARLKAYIAWLLDRCKGYAPKLVNPGGVEAWKQAKSGRVDGLDDKTPTFDLTARQIIQGVVRATNELGLPHPLHLHCNQLGMPGNWSTTLETMQSLEGMRGHLTHIQFHSYGGGDADEGTLNSRVEALADYVNKHPKLTVDVGQVMFGQTTNMTGDGPLGYFLHKATGARWYSHDTELEAGCGVLPMTYRNKNLFNALQWAVGLEWYLLVKDPWQVVMSTDHPNGGSFMAYPELIRLLMDSAYRREVLKRCPETLLSRCGLADLEREYTLGEIAIITRAGPARILGLKNKGHLGVGADADITIYTPDANQATMFELPRTVIKAGELIIENGELRSTPIGKTLYTEAKHDAERLTDLPEWFNENYTVRFSHYGVDEVDVADSEAVIADGS